MAEGTGRTERGGAWTVFSGHGLVLFYLAGNPHTTQRAVSDALDLTERHVGRLVRDLEAAGMVRVERRGRRNAYAVNPDARLRHPALGHVRLGRLVAALAPDPEPVAAD